MSDGLLQRALNAARENQQNTRVAIDNYGRPVAQVPPTTVPVQAAPVTPPATDPGFFDRVRMLYDQLRGRNPMVQNYTEQSLANQYVQNPPRQ